MKFYAAELILLKETGNGLLQIGVYGSNQVEVAHLRILERFTEVFPTNNRHRVYRSPPHRLQDPHKIFTASWLYNDSAK